MAINTAQWQLTLQLTLQWQLTLAINTMAINTMAQWQLTLHNGN